MNDDNNPELDPQPDPTMESAQPEPSTELSGMQRVVRCLLALGLAWLIFIPICICLWSLLVYFNAPVWIQAVSILLCAILSLAPYEAFKHYFGVRPDPAVRAGQWHAPGGMI